MLKNILSILLATILIAANCSFTIAQSDTEDSAEMIVASPPLTPADMNAVMTWISVQVAALRVPYCYKQSFGRGVGETLSGNCAPGTEKSGLLCYPKCKPGFTGVGPVCWGSCPSGFTDIGAFCQKPAPYGRGGGYPWKFGDGFNLSGATSRCERDNGGGNCEQSGAIIYPKCKPGFHSIGLICTPDCPSGYTDTGTGCTKPSFGRGAGQTLACRPGLEQNGLLCYQSCNKEGYVGDGPVCWQQCPSQAPVNCGAGCATSTKDCALVTANMVISPVMMAVSIASLGSASGATTGVNATTKTAGAAARGGAGLARIKGLFATIKEASIAAKGNVQTFVGGAQNLERLQTAFKIGKGSAVATKTIARQVEVFRDEFADNFAEMTSPEIESEIDKHFSVPAAREIKRQWGLRHLALMMEADGEATFKNYLTLLSIADPSGVTGVVQAFFHSKCKDNLPFPSVNPLY